MAKFTVTVNRTRTIESSIDVEVSAKDEVTACEKVGERIGKAERDGTVNDFDWEVDTDDDTFEYDASEDE